MDIVSFQKSKNESGKNIFLLCYSIPIFSTFTVAIFFAIIFIFNKTLRPKEYL